MAIELVVGLGNPGKEYETTRHNVGFRIVDAVARRLRAGRWERRFLSDLAHTGRGRSVWLAKPRTFMNRSGLAVAELTSGLGIRANETLVVVDDVDLPLGRIRIRPSGGAGTHNGLRDIVAAIGTGFPRLRAGVGREGCNGDDLANYVLSPFEHDELETAGALIERAAEAVTVSIFEGLQRAMNRFNQTLTCEQPEE
jgi:PTH1 family peptidyl-tRNA hydrolase